MGKKKAPSKKQPPKPGGPSIARFFEKRLSQSAQQAEKQATHGAGGGSTASAAVGAGASSMAARQVEILLDDEPSRSELFLDNVMLSQDEDHARVVWKAPEASQRLQGSGGDAAVNLKEFLGRVTSSKHAAGNFTSSAADEWFEELLSQAADGDKPKKAVQNGASVGPGAQGSAAGRAAHPAGERPRQQPLLKFLSPPSRGGFSDALPAAGALNSKENDEPIAETPKAGVAAPGPLQGPFSAATTNAPSSAKASTMNRTALSHTPMPPMKRTSSAKTPGSAQPSTGKRRMAMLEILDQVEDLLSQNPSPGPCKTPGAARGRDVLGFKSRPPLSSKTPTRVHLALPSASPAGKERLSSQVRNKGRCAAASTMGSTHEAERHGPAGSGRKTSKQTKPGTGAKVGKQAKTMQRAAESVGQMCDELMLESPSPRVGPTVLFDAHAAMTAGQPVQNRSPGPCKTPGPPRIQGVSGPKRSSAFISSTPSPSTKRVHLRLPFPSPSEKQPLAPKMHTRGHICEAADQLPPASHAANSVSGGAAAGRALSKESKTGKAANSGMQSKTMQRAAESVGQMCDELMLDMPSIQVEPTVLFDSHAVTAAAEAETPTEDKECIVEPPPVHLPVDLEAKCSPQKELNNVGPVKDSLDSGGLPIMPGDHAAIRHVVLEVLRDDGSGKVLRLLNEFTDKELEVHLLDSWADTAAIPGDYLNVLADIEMRDGRQFAQVDYSKGLVVLHPDTLLSGTRITSAVKCLRQAAIDEMVGGDGGSSDKAVLGTLLHELFQAAIKSKSDPQEGEEALLDCIDDIIRQSTLQLFEVGLDEAAAREALTAAIPAIQKWQKTFCRSEPSADGVIDMGPKGAPGSDGLDKQQLAVTEVIDIEESVWSPRFGIKGMIDASVRVTLEDANQQQSSKFNNAEKSSPEPTHQHRPRVFSGGPAPRRCLGPRKRVVAPLELKTGKAYHGHRAQVTLYMLLMSDRYLTDVSTGFLWYMNEAKPQGVQYIHGEIASLLQLRNSLASYIARPTPPGKVPILPPMMRDSRTCGSCFQRTACMLLHGGMESGTSETAGAGEVFHDEAGHVQSRHADFMQKWMALVQAESQLSMRGTSEAWTRSSAQRASGGGGCLGGLRLLGKTSALEAGGQQATLGGSCDDTLCVLEGHNIQDARGQGPFSVGDRILLSVEGKHVAAARGLVSEVAPGRLTLRLRRPLSEHLVASYGCLSHTVVGDAQQSPGLWRVDTDSAISLAAQLRGNIVQLLVHGGPRSARLRELIVDLTPPSISGVIPEEAEQYLRKHSAKFNSDQDQAVRKVLQSHDYSVILGMPGSGKTSTICHLVGALAACGKSVLLTAYTNSAVDNMLLRLKAQGWDEFLRIGSRSIVHKNLQGHCLGSPRYPTDSVAELREIAANVLVVGTTCLGAGHALLQKRYFDVVVVDEASQITVPASLGALYRAGKFVLVGDHYQLPPLVLDPGAAQGGLSESLLEILARAHPSATAVLSSQYRMCAPIMALANRLVYSGEMRCGTPVVATARLELSRLPPSSSHDPWLSKVLSPSEPLVFLDTAGVAPEASHGSSSSFNPGERGVVIACIQALVAAGLNPKEAAIISPYRAQVNALANAVTQAGEVLAGTEVLTIDKSQGRDKSCVLMSLVKSNAEQKPGDLLTDWRRINVAITRAQHKLVLVGCAATLVGIPFFEEILVAAAEGGWLVRLPEHACRAPRAAT